MTSKIFDGQTAKIMKRAKITYKKSNIVNNARIIRDMTILNPPYDILGLRVLSDTSDVLSQCIDAYTQNTVGFGIIPKFSKDDKDYDQQTDPQFKQVNELINGFAPDRPAKKVIQELQRHVEECGNGYLEVIRNGLGDVVGGDTLKPEFMQVTKQNIVGVDGIPRRFRYFIYQNPTEDAANNAAVWYKSFGDPTPLNADGSIAEDGEGTATEVIQVKLGDNDDPYGVPRYIGAVIKIIGNRKADELNYNYFVQGRHVPLAIVVSNGQLTEDSEKSISQYSEDLGTESLQHKFMVIEAESTNESPDLNGKDEKPQVKLEHLADVIQKDALFLDYNENVRNMVLSKFRLPPVYIGLSSDYNRATVETAKELTEEQVFQPLREDYEWILNQMFSEYDFDHVQIAFKTPNSTNMDDVKDILTPAIQAGGVAPNDLRDILSKVLNKPLKQFDGDQYNYPINVQKDDSKQDFGQNELEKAYGKSSTSELAGSVRRLIRKAVANGQDRGTDS